MELILNGVIIVVCVLVIYWFSYLAAKNYNSVRYKIERESDFYTEIILGLEAAGPNLARPGGLNRETRLSVWELYNNLRVQNTRESKGIVLHRKTLETKRLLYKHMEEAKVNVEILPFIGILGTLCGFAVPYMLNVFADAQLSFQISGLGFFLAAFSTISALVALIYLKKNYEAEIMGKLDYYECQVQALEKILVDGNGFVLLERWLQTWPDEQLAEQAPKEKVEV